MHMHSHPMLCLLFPGRRLTSSSVGLRSLTHSLSLLAPQTSSSLVLILPELIEFSFLWERSQEACVRRERGVMEEGERQSQISGRSLGGIALPEVGSCQVPGGCWGPFGVTYIFILSTITPQHFKEHQYAGGQGQAGVLFYPSHTPHPILTQGR